MLLRSWDKHDAREEGGCHALLGGDLGRSTRLPLLPSPLDTPLTPHSLLQQERFVLVRLLILLYMCADA